ncbi:MAG: S9 family peptidase, partial [Tidjanibacter sp.]|nr:S9 family peptidase [Tidjanibacter sp.]
MKKLFMLLLLSMVAMGVSQAADNGNNNDRPVNRYELAERFTASKLGTMLFSTSVDPHWFPAGDKFWYTYKTGEGTRWYVVEPAKRRKEPMFDHDKMAAQLTEIVKDPFIAAYLPIPNLRVEEDGNTVTFEVKSSQDAKPKPLSKEDSLAGKKPKKAEGKEIFYFSYDLKT